MKSTSKYHNRKVDGFDSRKERDRFYQLKRMEVLGEISNLQKQVKIELIPSQRIDGKVVERPCTYVADFTYVDKDGKQHWEDVKGFKTKEYRLKKKMLLYLKGIRLEET